MAAPKFDIVENDETEQQSPKELGLLMLALKALSQRAIAAISDLFCLGTVFSAWWLWWSIPDPNTYQIVSLSIYAGFVLAANWLVRRR